MPLVSVTRLRLRSWRFLLPFVVHSFRSVQQIRRADGFLGGWTGTSGNNAFWTITVWRDEAAMRAYRDNGAHKTAMPRLMHWADEAAMGRYQQAADAAPTGAEALAAIRSHGRTSKVHHPTEAHRKGETAPDGRAPSRRQALRPM